jgi:imidazolonepropionase
VSSTGAGAQVFANASAVVTCAGPSAARRGAEMSDAKVLTGVVVAVTGERIAAVGPPAEIKKRFPSALEIDCRGGVLTPGLVDSHTHAVFGKSRAEEQELRASGIGYMEIAARGGGIHSSVRDLRTRSEAELIKLALPRLRRLMSYGATTVEIKSGYGLTTQDELKTLAVIGRLANLLPVRIVATWLGAHEIPVECRDNPNGRAECLDRIDAEITAVAKQGIARFADVFCEPGVFTVEESRRILSAAKAAGLALKLHADELEPSGGAELAAELGAVSADHLAAISEQGIRALAASGTVATILPGTMLFLGKAKNAPARAMIEAGAAVALATDFNPGTSPTPNLPLMMTLGVSVLHLSAAEAMIAVTANGAAALGLAGETGQIAAGFSADISLFDIADWRELAYWYGDRRCVGTWCRGKPCHPLEPGLS